MNEMFETAVRCLVGSTGGTDQLTGIDIQEQFRPEEDSPQAVFRNLNAAFLISLCGRTHPKKAEADRYLTERKGEEAWSRAAGFFQQGLTSMKKEMSARLLSDRLFEESLGRLHLWLQDTANLSDKNGTIDRFWEVFFPEGVGLFRNRSQQAGLLLKRRVIEITELNPDPVGSPACEILFTSNVLLTMPPKGLDVRAAGLPREIESALRGIEKEPQVYWYDHPIQVGTATERNEMVYGLRGLDRAAAFEKERGNLDEHEKINCLLSVSVTHTGLRKLGRPYVQAVLKEARDIRHLRVYAFTESETDRLLEEVLLPAVHRYLGCREDDLLEEIIGVDGEYGRHYSFLKAISALWQVLLDPRLKATFKIDLDQVFPQNELVLETGSSAFEHLMTPLWGAQGVDTDGRRVDLGMIAGALVNEADIERSLFTPDVRYPDEDISGEEWVFLSTLPQALSTEVEMMTRYDSGGPDGRGRCLQRVHVTGGTCGILVDSLRRHRPFTPGFIGRAEDQAYLLSVLFGDGKGHLRYVHKDGLIMRHDKEAFAQEAIKAAHIGKIVGDHIRILLFSHYADALPWPLEETKRTTAPFTGCFISRIPFTLVYLRLALKAASLFEEGSDRESMELLRMGSERLGRLVRELSGEDNHLRELYSREKRGWDIFYDLLEKVEQALSAGDPFAVRLKRKAKDLFETCLVTS